MHTNDADRPRFQLRIEGHVERFVTISPRKVKLAGAPDQMLKAVVSIMQEDKYPFEITGIRASEGKYIKYSIEKVKGSHKTAYMLVVENLKKTEGKYYDRIFLDTDSKIKPLITINVSGFIRKPVKKNPK